MGIAGTWRAAARQATFGETPVRSVREGDIADLVIRSDGTGYAVRKRLFKEERQQLFWETIHSNGNSGYIIQIPESNLLIAASLSSGRLVTMWDSTISAVDGMGVIYERVR